MRVQPTATNARSSEREDLLERYLADIRHVRVLAPDEEIALSRRIIEGEAAFREAMLDLPFAAVQLLERWETIRSEGRVTGTLVSVRRPEGVADRSPEIDALFTRIARSLVQRRRHTAQSAFDPAHPSAAITRIDRGLAARLREVAPRTDLLFEVYVAARQRADRIARLRRIRGGRRAQAAEEARLVEIETGLSGAALGALLARAGTALDDLSEARETFIHHNMRLVVSVSKEFRGMGVDFLDLIQEGNTGLVRAVEKFDYRQGCRFSTYGVWWIRQSCIRAIQNTSRTVRLPTNLHDRLLRYRRAAATLESDPGSEGSLGEVAVLLGTDERELAALIEFDRRPLALDEPVTGTESLTVGDRIEDGNLPEPESLLDAARLEQVIPRLLETLGDRERQVLAWRFGLADGTTRTLQEIGNELGLSRERVRQIERGALDQLRGEAQQRGLEELARGEEIFAH